MLNVCSPSPEEQQEIASALARIPKQPLFSPDFEVDRGRSTLDQSPDFLKAGASAQFSSDPGTADWVRVRREFSVQALFSTVQYSFSQDPKNMVETLIFHVRDPKDLMQVAIEDSASAVTTAGEHADHEHSGQPHQAGALRQVIGRAGALSRNGGKSGAGPKRLRAAVSERDRNRRQLSQSFGSAEHRARGVGAGQQYGSEESKARSEKRPKNNLPGKST